MYLDHARFLIDIMVKKKKNPDEHLVHKFEDYPLEYRSFIQDADADINQKSFIPVGTNGNTGLNLSPMSEKQLALYRYIQNAKLNRNAINEGTKRVPKKDDANPGVVEDDMDALYMRNHDVQAYCLFKLSDLGMWKSFPRFLLKRGFEVVLYLDSDFADINCNPKFVAAGGAGINTTNLYGLGGDPASQDIGAYYKLKNGICITNFTVPDERHLKLMLDQMQAGELTFPYYTWNMSQAQKCTQTNSVDCSYSGSRIDRTYFTFVNQSIGGDHDPKYEIKCGAYKTQGGGLRAYHGIKRLHVDIQGIKFPSADGLTNAGPA